MAFIFRILVLTWFAVLNAWSQVLPEDLHDVLAGLDRTSPVLAAASTELAIARAEMTASRALPNPTIFIEREDLSADGIDSRETTIGGKQDLGFLWSLPARISAGTHAHNAGQSVYAEARRALEAEIIVESLRASNLQEQVLVLDTVVNLGRQLEHIAEERRNAGEISGFDVERVHNEVLDLIARRAVVAEALNDSHRRLVDLTGLPVDTFHDLAPLTVMDPWFSSPEEAIAHALEHREALRQMHHEKLAADRALTASRLAMLPNLGIGVGAKEADDDFRGSVWEVELEIPLFQQRRTAGAIARARREQAERNQAASRHRVEQEVRGAFQQWVTLHDLGGIHSEDISIRTRSSVERATVLYTEGKFSALELTDALHSSVSALSSVSELAERRLASIVELRRVTGLPVWE